MSIESKQVVAENASCYSCLKREFHEAVRKHDWDKVQDLAKSLESYKSYLEDDGVDVTRLT